MTEQEKREKVIRGLKAHGYTDCTHCPYWGTGHFGLSECKQLARDAFALLKAQEQEPIVPIRRSAHAQGADDVWYECGKCGKFLGVNPYSKQFCANCGREVKWE